MNLILDENILAKIVHPHKHRDVQAWFRRAVILHRIYVPEPADYELRRELIRWSFVPSLVELDRLGAVATFLHCTRGHWLHAADLWAEARKTGRPGADDKDLDADLLITAQALAVEGTVVTNNLRHFKRFVAAMDWHEVPTGSSGDH